eukprot:PLAT4521.1.p1 GENE.PLAT4521.1~~PLAT4521.1.p1  ORF type:complete len:370 (+),score=164.23 PLAT4521.1:131-1240(+)
MYPRASHGHSSGEAAAERRWRGGDLRSGEKEEEADEVDVRRQLRVRLDSAAYGHADGGRVLVTDAADWGAGDSGSLVASWKAAGGKRDGHDGDGDCDGDGGTLELSLEDVYDVSDVAAGAGSYGTVKLATCRRRGADVAVKVIDRSRLYSSYERACVEREAAVHAQLQHDGIIQLHAVYQDDDNVYLVMDRAAGDLARALVNSGGVMEEAAARRLFSTVMSGLSYLHDDQHVLHGDLKPDNVLLMADGSAKLCDFGTARRLQADGKPLSFDGVIGTTGYIAPELLEQQDYSQAVDMWSAGILLYQLLVGYTPFYPASACLTEPADFPDRYWRRISPAAKQLTQALLQRDPAARPTCADVLASDWLASAA